MSKKGKGSNAHAQMVKKVRQLMVESHARQYEDMQDQLRTRRVRPRSAVDNAVRIAILNAQRGLK